VYTRRTRVPRQRRTAPRLVARLLPGVAVLLAVVLWMAGPAAMAQEPPPQGEPMAEAAGGHDGTHAESHVVKHIDNWFGLSYGSDKERHNAPIGWALINFAILCYLLVHFARDPLRQYLATRQAQVQKSLAEARELRESARAKLDEIDAKLDRFDIDVAEIKANVKKDAEVEKAKIIESARAEADRLIQQAEKTLARELRRAHHTLEVEAVDRALRVAEARIRKSINDADRKKINEEYISRIASSGGVQ